MYNENPTGISSNSNDLKNMCHTKISIKEENLNENQQYEDEGEDYYFSNKQETTEDDVYETNVNQIKLENQESENEIQDVGNNDSVDFHLHNNQHSNLSNSREDMSMPEEDHEIINNKGEVFSKKLVKSNFFGNFFFFILGRLLIGRLS